MTNHEEEANEMDECASDKEHVEKDHARHERQTQNEALDRSGYLKGVL